ncbi:MAG: hypothetical protein AABX02_03815 [archaeon]
MNPSRLVKALVFFVVGYVLLYLLYATQSFLPKWDGYGASIFSGQPLSGYLFVDPLFLLIPLIGFAFMWLSISWFLHHFKDEQVLSIPFALVFLVGSYLSFFVALIGYYWNNAYLVALANGDPSPATASFGFTWGYALSNFVTLLLASPFFLFVLAGLWGWVSYILIHRYWNERLPHHAA